MTRNFVGQTLHGRPFELDEDLVRANFRDSNLRGVNFKNLDLSGADFSNADIRGANFCNATLVETNFSKVRAGLEKRSKLLKIALAFLLTVLTSCCTAFLNEIYTIAIFSPNFIKRQGISLNIVVLLLIIFTYFSIAQQGFKSRAVIVTIITGAVLGGALSFIVSQYVSHYQLVSTESVTPDKAIAVSIFLGIFLVLEKLIVISVGADAVSRTFAAIGSSSRTLGITILIIGMVLGLSAVQFVFVYVFLGVGKSIISEVIVDAIGYLFFSVYLYLRISREDENFIAVRNTGIKFGCWGGTTFCGANLSRALFIRAVLENTNFSSSKQQPTLLTHVDWTEAKHLNYANLTQSILANCAVRELLVTRHGDSRNYEKLSLRSANLSGVHLIAANLKQVDLTNAICHETRLDKSNLKDAIVVGTDFTGAYLTEACIEDWILDATTILTQNCQCIYLLEEPDFSGNRERRPRIGTFAPGEFSKLFQELLNTITLVFEDGIDWKAFVTAFKTLQDQNQDTELSIQSVENKGDGTVLVRVNAPLTLSKEKLRRDFTQNYETDLKALEARYQAELEDKDREINFHREKYLDMREISFLLAQQKINVTARVESKIMNDSSDSSRKIQIGDVSGNLTASSSAFNLGDISGTVTNILNQLQSSNQSNASELSDHLKQLKSAIETETNLNSDDKVEALEQVNALAQAGQNPQDASLKKEANKAVKILRGTLVLVPSAATFAKACSELLPVITKLLGL